MIEFLALFGERGENWMKKGVKNSMLKLNINPRPKKTKETKTNTTKN